ncbi:hypothetical protein SAMN05518846_108156 [Brevibacillus centrosporus]|uniref:Uncharacterized protein n=1 Tax=Brevibacillus centrosporus TaxID=54910 RepID=A0A1I3WK25_9BACL|nr:hypothetical protein SAMN05518846_108156 [Brevibacillus centrosporus]
MFDNYYATEYQLRQSQAELEKRSRFVWMLADLKDNQAKLITKVEIQPQPSCCPSL